MLDKRQVEVAIVVVSLVALAVSARVVTVGIDQLWAAERLFYGLANVTAEPVDGNRDIPVLLFVGTLFGWLVLFVFDGTKRIQALCLVAVGTVSVGLFLSETGRILDAIGRHPTSFVVGTIIGVGTGAVPARLFGVKTPDSMGLVDSLAWIQFDTAAAWFRHAISVIVLVATVDYLLLVQSVDGVVVAASTLVLLVALSVFVKYDYQRNVVAVSPPDPDDSKKYQPYVFGGLYDEAKRNYHGFTIESPGALLKAQKASSLNSLPDFERMVAFGFASGIRPTTAGGMSQLGAKILPRTGRLQSEGVATGELPTIHSERNENETVLLLKLAGRRMYLHIVTLVPRVVRDRLPNRGVTMKDKLDGADVVLLIGPTLEDDEPIPAGVEVFDHICTRYAADPTTEVVLATTEAPPDSVESHTVKIGAKKNLQIGDDNLSYTKVYPVSRFGKDGENHGFEPLLNELLE